MTLLLAANRGRIDEQDGESPEFIGGSDRKYMREYETQSIIGHLCYLASLILIIIVHVCLIIGLELLCQMVQKCGNIV